MIHGRKNIKKHFPNLFLAMRSPLPEVCLISVAFTGYHSDIDCDERVISTFSIILMFLFASSYCGESNLRLVLILLFENPAGGIPKE